MFFVLSGFLIGGILIDNQKSVNYFKVFYVRRMCRIFPLYFSWVLLFIALRNQIHLMPAEPFKKLFGDSMPIISYATFTQNIFQAHKGIFGAFWIAATWSLAVEEQFYLVLPLLVRYLSQRRLLLTLGCLIVAAPMLRIAIFYIHSHGKSVFQLLGDYVLMPCRADALLLGVVCALMVRHPPALKWLASHTRFLYALMGLMLIGVTFLTLKSPETDSFHMISWGYSCLALLYTTILLLAITEKKQIVGAITQVAFLRGLGSIAYGVYIIHVPLLYLLYGVFLHRLPSIHTGYNSAFDWFFTSFSLLLTMILSYLSWHFFEKRFVALGHAYKYDRN